MKRVEGTLGKGWELYSDGSKLLNESMSFRRKLDTKPIYDSWLQEITSKSLSIGGRVFGIQKGNRHSQSSGLLQLFVDFDAQIVSLFKEVRNLIWLG